MMDSKDHSHAEVHVRVKYRVQVSDHVSEELSEYYSGLTLLLKDDPDQAPETEIVGWLADQTALLGMLNLLHEWGYFLLSVEYLRTE